MIARGIHLPAGSKHIYFNQEENLKLRSNYLFWEVMAQTSANNSTNTVITPAALKLKEACQYLGGISPVTIRRLINRGKLKRHPAFRHIVIPVSSLDRFLAEADSKQ